VDRLILVVLAVALQEQAEIWPAQIDPGNEEPVRVVDPVLTSWLPESVDLASE
jgi:hypothetical protein